MAQTKRKSYSVAEAMRILGIPQLRGQQAPCIRRILTEGRDTFCIMPTGAGKSACYQIPGLVLPGLVLVVSPLLSLMRDQIDELSAHGVCAAALSGQGLYAPLLPEAPGPGSWNTVRRQTDALYFLYTTPELLRRHTDFFAALDLSLLVIDEAHCVSGWGMDFRPSYRILRDFVRTLERLDRRPVIAAFTATADSRVVEDTIFLLGMRMEADERLEAAPVQPTAPRSIRLFDKNGQKDLALAEFIQAHRQEKGIIFCMKKEDMPKVAQVLQSLFPPDEDVFGYYYGGVATKDAMGTRNLVQRRFKDGRLRIMIATSAFGMGVNIPDIRYVVHYSFPSTMADYIQQCGRAGRDGKGAECILLASLSDFRSVAGMVEHRSLLTYSLPWCVNIRRRDKADFCSFVTHCIAACDDKAAARFSKEVQALEARPIAEEQWLQTGARFLVLNCSTDLRERVRQGKLSYYDSILADGVYSLWYNGRTAFTLRELACFISGDADFVFHGGRSSGSAIKEELRLALDRLIATALLPITKKPACKRDTYVFTAAAMANLPWVFPLQEQAALEQQLCAVPEALLARQRPSDGRRGEVKTTRDHLLIKYYLLRELSRMRRTRTEPKIIYSRIPHRAGASAPVGLLHIAPFLPDGLSAANRNSKARYIHGTVCRILDELKAASYLYDWSELELSPDRLAAADPRDSGALVVDGRYIRGIAIIF